MVSEVSEVPLLSEVSLVSKVPLVSEVPGCLRGLVPFRLQAIRLRAITPTGTVSPTVSLNWICMRAHMPRACVSCMEV